MQLLRSVSCREAAIFPKCIQSTMNTLDSRIFHVFMRRIQSFNQSIITRVPKGARKAQRPNVALEMSINIHSLYKSQTKNPANHIALCTMV